MPPSLPSSAPPPAPAAPSTPRRPFRVFRRRTEAQRFRDAALLPLREALAAFVEAAGRPEQAQLTQLWRHWDMVMGEMLAPLVIPLGARRDVLTVGAEDTMIMQELTYMTDEILERVNAFMGEPYFNHVKVTLPLGKKNLTAPPQAGISSDPVRLEWKEVLTGKYLDQMPPDSPVTRCYAAYVAAGKARRS